MIRGRVGARVIPLAANIIGRLFVRYNIWCLTLGEMGTYKVNASR